jgi:ParB/RepB/Spo0J family partition protein
MTKTATKPAKKAAARPPLLAKALETAPMSSATEDLLTKSAAWQPGETSALQHLPIDVVFPAADNPRANLGDLDGLAASIAAVGVLEPILVRLSPVVQVKRVAGDTDVPVYQIVAGHRRHAAAKIAGLDLIPCLVREFTEQARIEAMVIENLQRQDLSPFDEARGLTQLVNVGLSQRDIAERVGCSQSHVSKRLSLASMPAEAEKLFTDERLTVRQVEELAKVPEADRGGVVAGLVEHAVKAKDSLLPAWALDEAIKQLKTKRKHLEAEGIGMLSGLKRLDARPYDSPGGSHRVCKKGDASHWFLGERDTSILWARTQAAHNKVNPPVEMPRSRWDVESQAAARIEAFIGDRILPAVVKDEAARAVFIASVTTLTRERLEIAWLRVPALDADLLPNDDALYIAAALLCAIASVRWTAGVLELFIAHGYRTTGEGETFPEGFDATPILIAATEP